MRRRILVSLLVGVALVAAAGCGPPRPPFAPGPPGVPPGHLPHPP